MVMISLNINDNRGTVLKVNESGDIVLIGDFLIYCLNEPITVFVISYYYFIN